METETIEMAREDTSEIPPQDLDDENICCEQKKDGEEEMRIGEKEDLNPQAGMSFDSLEEVKKFYKNYAYNHGFNIVVRTSKKKGIGNNVNVRYHTFTCDRGGKSRRTSKNTYISHPSIKIECKAKINVKEFEDGRVVVLKVIYEHNHGLSPGQPRNRKSHNKIISWVKRRFEINDQAGNLGLGEGDVESVSNDFDQMQDKHPKYIKIPSDDKGDMEKLKRYDALFNRFRSLATIGAMRDGSYKLLMEFLDHAEEKLYLEKEVCNVENEVTMSNMMLSPSTVRTKERMEREHETFDGENARSNLSNMVDNTSKVHTKENFQREKLACDPENELNNLDNLVESTKECQRPKRKQSKEEGFVRTNKKKNLDEQVIAVDEKKEEINPQAGLGFDSLDEAKKFYKKYASHQGFDVVVRNSKKKENCDETVRYHTFICDRGGKTRRTSKNILNYRLSIKTDCKAKMNMKEFEDGTVVISKVIFEHNHGLSPGQSRHVKSH